MTADALDAATRAATETLLNCYLRETHHWSVHDDLLTVTLPRSPARLQVKLRHRSATGRHRYLLPVELVGGEQAAPVGFVALTGLLLDGLADGPVPGSTELAARMLDSLHNVAEFLDHRRDDIDRLWSAAPLSFIESEQALLTGHPLHPTPKSRRPLTPDERRRYSPETGGSFRLRWLAVEPDLVRHGSALAVTAPDLSRALAEQDGLRRLPALRPRTIIPAHPWELAYLRRQPEVAALMDAGAVIDLGATGEPATPTTSVRTVYRADWSWQLKFSLHVQVTNSLRVTLPKELDRAVEAARLWQTRIGRAAALVAPRFTPIHDPAYLTIAPDGRVIDGFSVLFRHNLWPGGSRSRADVTSLTSLCQDHPFGGPSRLGNIVRHRAARDGVPPPEAGRAWFGRFLEVAVASLVRLYLDLGLCFEPHQQNTLLELDADGMPTRSFYRDSQGYFHRELAHADLCRVIPGLGEATESIFPEALADERLVYYPFLNLTLGVVDALGAAGCADETVLLADLRHYLETERSRPHRYPPTLLDRLLDDERWPCKGNLRTRLHDMDELVGDIADQSVYVTVPNPLTAPGGSRT